MLTILRLVIIPFFLFSLFHQQHQFAFYLFMIAGLTDGMDGWLARRYHWRSAFGSFTDPLSDKLLIASSFISLAYIGSLPWWLVILVFLRDMTISFGVLAWYYFIRLPIEFKPTFLSKINTVLQLALVTLCLFELAFFPIPVKLQTNLILLTALTTCFSFVDYVLTWSRKALPIKKPL